MARQRGGRWHSRRPAAPGHRRIHRWEVDDPRDLRGRCRRGLVRPCRRRPRRGASDSHQCGPASLDPPRRRGVDPTCGERSSRTLPQGALACPRLPFLPPGGDRRRPARHPDRGATQHPNLTSPNGRGADGGLAKSLKKTVAHVRMRVPARPPSASLPPCLPPGFRARPVGFRLSGAALRRPRAVQSPASPDGRRA